MELRQLATFRAVASALSFTRAAESLDYAQSSVTAQIRALEEELGTPLFERLGKRVALTAAGQRLVPYADRLLRLSDEARAVVPDGDEYGGALLIGAPESLCVYRLPPVLSQFHARFPRVQVTFRPGSCADLRRSLIGGQLDVAFLLEESLPSPQLCIEPLVPEPLLLLAHPDHPLASLASVEPQMLNGEQLLLTEAGCSYREHLERTVAAASARPAGVLEFSSIEAIKQCAIAGMGITYLPAITVTVELAEGKLVALPYMGRAYRLVTQMAWHRDKRLTPALQALLALSRDLLAVDAQTRAS